jgi:hypothetical protein
VIPAKQDCRLHEFCPELIIKCAEILGIDVSLQMGTIYSKSFEMFSSKVLF